jgi:hypothetical protein
MMLGGGSLLGAAAGSALMVGLGAVMALPPLRALAQR